MEKVATLTIVFLILTLFLTLVSPLVCLFYSIRTLRARFLAILLGAACYLFFGILFPSATLNLIYTITPDLFAVLQNSWSYVLLISLMSALWIEVGRYNVQKINTDLYPGPVHALAFGLGFASLPTILVGIGSVSSLMLTSSINQNGLTAFLAQLQESGVLPEELDTIRAFVAESPFETLWKMLLQISLYVVQISLSLLLQPAVEKNGTKWLFPLCFLIQFLLQWTITMPDAGLTSSKALTSLLCVGIAFVVTYGTVLRTKVLYPNFTLIKRDYRPLTYKKKR